MNFPYIYTEANGRESLTVFLGGVPTEIDETHSKFSQILEGVDTLTQKEVRELLDTGKQVRRTLAQFGNITVLDGAVTYKGEVVNSLLAQRMLNMVAEGRDVRPWALFMENLQKNPAKHAVDELYLWLERGSMPITPRGNFLAYKKVRDNYTSYHNNADGTPFRNDIGTVVSMPRNKVDDNRARTCSTGLHFCSWDYLPSYMGNQGKVVLVEVNPAHVVSIPSDYNNAKGRAEQYTIVGEIPESECKHAFPGLSYVDFDSSDYITVDSGTVDYSSVEDGLYNDTYHGDDLDEVLESAYQAGYDLGKIDGKWDEYYDEDTALEAYEEEWDYVLDDEEALEFTYGYGDGFYQGKGEAVNNKSISAFEKAAEELKEEYRSEVEDELDNEQLVRKATKLLLNNDVRVDAILEVLKLMKR